MNVSMSLRRGLTLVELCVAIALLVVLLGLAAPSLGDASQRQRLLGLAAQFQSDVAYARSSAAARDEALRITFPRATGGSGYLLHSGDAQQCGFDASGQAHCTPPARVLKAVFVDAKERVALQANVGSMLFDPLHGTVTPSATLNLVAAEGHTVRAIVNLMGRSRSCVPAGAMSGLKTC